MALNDLTWETLEAIVADAVWGRYSHFTNDKERKKFCGAIKEAHHLLRLAAGNVDYNHIGMGVAYALRWHLQRLDNICTSLKHIHNINPLAQNMKVLDIGSGTGAGAMAICYWIVKNFDTLPREVEIFNVEQAKPMRNTSFWLISAFLEEFERLLNLGESPFPFKIYSDRFISLQERASLTGIFSERDQFDLILFSCTFDVQKKTMWEKTTAQIVAVSKLLKPGGVMMFLTPTLPPDKIEFMASVSQTLTTKSRLKDLGISVKRGFYPGISSYAPAKRPQAIMDLRKKINDECDKADINVPITFPQDPDADYYGFYCILQAFVRPKASKKVSSSMFLREVVAVFGGELLTDSDDAE